MRSWWSCACYRGWLLSLAHHHTRAYETTRCALPRNDNQVRTACQQNCSGIIGPNSTIKTTDTRTKFASEKSELIAGSHPRATAITITHNTRGTVFPTLCITRHSDWTQKGTSKTAQKPPTGQHHQHHRITSAQIVDNTSKVGHRKGKPLLLFPFFLFLLA